MRNKTPLAFAEWAPDKASVSGAAGEAKGVVYLGGRYAPDKALLPYKTGSAIGGAALGGAGFYENGVTVRTFLADASALYEIVARVPVNISKAGGYAASVDWPWSFEQFGQNIIATARGLSQLQHFRFGTDTVFGDLATGPGASDGLFRIREFLFSGRNFTMKNSAFNNYTDWVPDSGTQAGEFDLPGDGGIFVAGVGGQFGLIFQERKVHRMTYTGGAAPFERDEIEDKRGALGPRAVCRYGGLTFFASEDGFRVTDGNSSEGIGEGKVDRYFASRLNYARRSLVSMSVDMEKRLLRVIFPTGGSSQPSEMLVYSIADQKWTHDDCDLSLIFEAPRPGININDDTGIAALAGSSVVDNIAIPIDSSVWRESRKQIIGVNYSGEAGTFEGANRPATIETGYGESMPGRVGFVSEIWPLVDADTVSAIISTKRNRLSETPVETATATMNAQGFVPVLAEGRWIKAQVSVPSGVSWSEASGIDWDVEAAGDV